MSVDNLEVQKKKPLPMRKPRSSLHVIGYVKEINITLRNIRPKKISDFVFGGRSL